MPFGLANDVAGVVVKPIACSAPPWFRPAEGVRFAWPDADGPFKRTPRIPRNPTKAAGVRYERKAIIHLREVFGTGFRAHQWFRFQNLVGATRWCQPDAFHITEDGYATLVEIKVTFTSDAWWQLRHLYEPVLLAAFKPKAIRSIVVCKSFDPKTQFPEAIEHVSPPFKPGSFQMGVYVWTPQS